MVAKLAKLGIVPGQDFDAAKLEPAVAKGIAGAPKPAQDLIMGWMKAGIAAGDMKLENGWLFTTKTGLYGTSYLQRALVTAIGLGANRPQDAVYPTSEGPDSEEVQRREQVRHALRQGPAAAGGGLLVADHVRRGVLLRRQRAQPLQREPRNNLKANPDGSVDLYIQHESPGKDKESNWLPAPKDEFVLMLRMYWPKEKPPSILDGTWKVPEVKEAS